MGTAMARHYTPYIQKIRHWRQQTHIPLMQTSQTSAASKYVRYMARAENCQLHLALGALDKGMQRQLR